MEYKLAFLLKGKKMDQDFLVWKRRDVDDNTIDVSRITSGMKKVKSLSCF